MCVLGEEPQPPLCSPLEETRCPTSTSDPVDVLLSATESHCQPGPLPWGFDISNGILISFSFHSSEKYSNSTLQSGTPLR